MRCFYCQNIGNEGETANLGKRETHHLFKTLRGDTGTELELIDGKGVIAVGRVGTDRQIVIISRKMYPEPRTRIHLFTALPKKNKLDLLLSQIVEVGAWTINPLRTERSVSVPEKKSVRERWQAILIESCKQSKNPFLPEIRELQPFPSAIQEIAAGNYTVFFGIPTGGMTGIDISSIKSNDVVWIVGPEGGFTDSENQLMTASGFHGLSIGNWVMRIETAAVTGVNLLNHLIDNKN